MKQLLKRWLAPEGSIARILIGPCRGMRFRVSTASGRSMILGYERKHQHFVAAKVRPGMTVFDIGANVGQYTLLFARLVGPSGRVLSFEPYGPAFRALSENVLLNGLKNVQVLNLAIAERTGYMSFTYNPSSASMGKLSHVEMEYERQGQHPHIEVETATLDEMTARHGTPDLLKIDTEGAAASVLAGAAQTLQHNPSLFVELHGPEEQAAIDRLIAQGYRFEDLDGKPVTDMKKWASPLWGTRGKK